MFHDFPELKVHITWVSPFNGQLLIKRNFWDYGEPLLLIGLRVTYPPEIIHCVFNSGTSEWNTLEQIFTNYTSNLDTYFNNLHAYEKKFEYISTYLDTENDWMPLYLEKDEQHLVQFLWDSPNNGIPSINKIVWNAQGDPIRQFGKIIGQNGLGDLYLEIFPNTSTWQHLYFRLLDYKQFYGNSTTNQHIFGELTSFMSIYPKH